MVTHVLQAWIKLGLFEYEMLSQLGLMEVLKLESLVNCQLGYFEFLCPGLPVLLYSYRAHVKGK